MSIQPSKEDNTSLRLMQHNFLLKSALLDLPLVWVFCLDWGETGGRGGYFGPSRGRYTVEICSKFSDSHRVRTWGICDEVGACLSAVWLLQDRVEPQPIFPGDRDVGRHLPRHLWSHPQAPRSTSGLWTRLIGERICTFGAIIAEWWSVLRGNKVIIGARWHSNKWIPCCFVNIIRVVFHMHNASSQ